MDIKPIFGDKYDKSDCKLWSVLYDNETEDELARLFDLWNDIFYLREYFKEKQQFLNRSFWQPMTIDQAISKTIREATDFEEKLLQIEDDAQEHNVLDELFKTFEDLYYEAQSPYSVKGKPDSNTKPFLRLYGLQTDNNCIIITGGGIKLTRTIQEDPTLNTELSKLSHVKQFLVSNGITIISQYGEQEEN